MNEHESKLEQQVETLRHELVRLREAMIYGFIGLGAAILIGLSAPVLGIAILAVLVVLGAVAAIAAVIGIWNGRRFPFRWRRTPDQPQET